MNGQAILADESMAPPRKLILVFTCQKCGWIAQYEGPDFIALRAQAHTEGWRKRGTDWYFGEHVPNGKDAQE